MRISFISAVASVLAAIPCSAQIYADFHTSAGDFSVVLDHTEAPLAVSNFIHLAGKGDDIFETRDGVPPLSTEELATTHDRHGYNTTTGSDAVRLPLTVSFVKATEAEPAMYVIRQSQTFIGAVQAFQAGDYYADITGQDRIRLALVNAEPRRYRITMRYPRPWLDARYQIVRNTPMYRGLSVTQVETGKRFFAGGVTDSVLEHPGYQFQDEILRDPGNTRAPYGTPFHSGWVLAMDSVGPNRNGSRFFVTSARDTTWNGRYTAFGKVVQNAGRTVVQGITNSATDSNNVPINKVVINDITIRRVGNLPQSFFPAYHQSFLPGEIEALPMTFENRDTGFSLVTPLRPATQTTVYTSTDLLSFVGGAILAQPPSAIEPLITNLSNSDLIPPKIFVKGFAAAVPSWPSAKVNLAGSTFSFRVNSGNDTGTLRLDFDPNGINGVYRIDMEVEQTGLGQDPVLVVSEGEGQFTATYHADAGPYIGTINFNSDVTTGPLNIQQIRLHIDSTRFANNPQVPIANIIRRFDAQTTDTTVPYLNYGGIFQQLK